MINVFAKSNKVKQYKFAVVQLFFFSKMYSINPVWRIQNILIPLQFSSGTSISRRLTGFRAQTTRPKVILYDLTFFPKYLWLYQWCIVVILHFFVAGWNATIVLWGPIRICGPSSSRWWTGCGLPPSWSRRRWRDRYRRWIGCCFYSLWSLLKVAEL